MSTEAEGRPLEELVARALELRDDGHEGWLEMAVAGRPALREAVQGAISRLELLPRALGADVQVARSRMRRLAGRYELVGPLGSGAMGTVYDAQDHELQRRVAVKLMHAGVASSGTGFERFLKEAEAMAAVEHPGVIRVFDRGTTEAGEPFIVMEHVDGVPLDGLLEELAGLGPRLDSGRMSALRDALDGTTLPESSYLRSVVRWARDVARGLAAAHAAGVVHRDVKPSNILIRRDGSPVLLDFGVAALAGMETLTRGDTGVGTPTYMAPETVGAGKNRATSSDVYGLSAALYHLVTLRRPYEGTAHQVLAAIVTRDPVPASRLVPGLPRDLLAILERGMHRSPARRFTSVAALADDLDAFLECRPVTSRPISRTERVARRLSRSKGARGAVAALLMAGALLATLGLVDARERARAERYRAAYAGVSWESMLSSPDGRRLRDEGGRALLAGRLDAAVDDAHSALPCRLLRASLRWDHGDRDGAVRDMTAIAHERGSHFAEELARRYVLAGPGEGPELDGIPAPAAPEDRYLLAYELIRAGRHGEAAPHLADGAVRALPHAEELHLMMLAGAGRVASDFARGRALVEELAERLGGPTVMTSKLEGLFLIQLGRYEEALAAMESALEHAPQASGIRMNAGWAAYRCGDPERALQHYEVALRARPDHWPIHRGAIWALLAQGEFDSARALVASAPFDDGRENERAYWHGVVLTHRALDELVRGEAEASRATAAEAFALGERYRAAPGFVPGLGEALVEELRAEGGRPFAAAARYLRDDPSQWRRQRFLLDLMPESLDGVEEEALKELFEHVVTFMAQRAR